MPLLSDALREGRTHPRSRQRGGKENICGKKERGKESEDERCRKRREKTVVNIVLFLYISFQNIVFIFTQKANYLHFSTTSEM